VKPTWNAAVCKGDIGRVNIGAGGGGGGGGFGGGPGAAKGGPGSPGAGLRLHSLLLPARPRVVPAQPRADLVQPKEAAMASTVAAPLDLFSQRSLSAGMERTSPTTEQPTCERAPRSR
jgi:hypothetical protein